MHMSPAGGKDGHGLMGHIYNYPFWHDWKADEPSAADLCAYDRLNLWWAKRCDPSSLAQFTCEKGNILLFFIRQSLCSGLLSSPQSLSIH